MTVKNPELISSLVETLDLPWASETNLENLKNVVESIPKCVLFATNILN
jgi:hypothetical protein